MADFKGMNGMIALKRVALICVSLVLAGLAGCSSSSTHIAYVTLPTSNSIAAFRVSNHSGKFTSVVGSPFPTSAGASPVALTVSPSGKYLYVASSTLGLVFGYSIGSGTGVLQQVPDSLFTVGSGPFSVAVDPAEHFVYVANSLSDTISVLSLDASTGTLTSPPNSPFTADKNPVSLAIDSAGKFLYVANLGGNNVSAFSLDSTTGVPTELTNPKSPFGAGTRPVFVTIDSTGKFLYVANENSRDISAFTIDSSTGGLTNGSIAASVGSAPTSVATTTK